MILLNGAGLEDSKHDDRRDWRERWAPNDAVSPLERERRFRYRIRIGTGSQVTQSEDAHLRSGSRQFAVVLITITGLALAAFAGPSLVRGAARLMQSVNAQFTPPPLPDAPTLPPQHVELPSAPPVPLGPY